MRRWSICSRARLGARATGLGVELARTATHVGVGGHALLPPLHNRQTQASSAMRRSSVSAPLLTVFLNTSVALDHALLLVLLMRTYNARPTWDDHVHDICRCELILNLECIFSSEIILSLADSEPNTVPS